MHDNQPGTTAAESSASSAVLACPFCGEVPQVSTEGTCIEIYCCATMDRQKSDYLTLEERKTWRGAPDYKYSDEAEAKVWQKVLNQWNTRAS